VYHDLSEGHIPLVGQAKRVNESFVWYCLVRIHFQPEEQDPRMEKGRRELEHYSLGYKLGLAYVWETLRLKQKGRSQDFLEVRRGRNPILAAIQ